MNTREQYFHKRPSGSKAEQNDIANDILKSFFEDYTLDQGHELLWQVIQQSFYTRHAILNNIQRSNLICFYERVHEMMVAGSILNEQNKMRKVEHFN